MSHLNIVTLVWCSSFKMTISFGSISNRAGNAVSANPTNIPAPTSIAPMILGSAFAVVVAAHLARSSIFRAAILTSCWTSSQSIICPPWRLTTSWPMSHSYLRLPKSSTALSLCRPSCGIVVLVSFDLGTK